MVQGRFEPSPAEQLLELRRSRDRYAALADRLHDNADPDLGPEEMLAREQNARRIAHAYEKSISNSVVRMSSMGETHRFAPGSLSMRTWLMIFMAISVLESGILLAHFEPQIFRLPRLQTATPKTDRALDRTINHTVAAPAPLKRAAPPAAPPIAMPQRAPAPIAPPVISPAPKPVQIAPAPKPVQIAPAPKTAAPPPAKPATAPTPPQTPTRATPAPTSAPTPSVRATPTPTPPTPSARATPTPTPPAPSARATPAPTPPAPSVPIPSARPTSGPVITATAPPAPVTQPPPRTPAPPPPSAPITTVTETPLAPITPPVAAAAPSPVAPSQAQAAAPVLTRPEAIAGTHTLPPYPGESKRMGESGKTQMKVTISPQGAATECTILIPSGSARLDAAACNHVETIWRWKPATRDGEPVAATAAVTVVWSLQAGR